MLSLHVNDSASNKNIHDNMISIRFDVQFVIKKVTHTKARSRCRHITWEPKFVHHEHQLTIWVQFAF